MFEYQPLCCATSIMYNNETKSLSKKVKSYMNLISSLNNLFLAEILRNLTIIKYTETGL